MVDQKLISNKKLSFQQNEFMGSFYPRVEMNVRKSLETETSIENEMPVKKKEQALYSKKMSVSGSHEALPVENTLSLLQMTETPSKL